MKRFACTLVVVAALQTALPASALQDAGDDAGEDAGDLEPPLDAGYDAGPPPQDAGPPPQDAGPPPQDAGPPPQDAGPPPQDAGPPPQDAGPPPQDAGPPPQDAGPAPQDAGPLADAGPPLPFDAGPPGGPCENRCIDDLREGRCSTTGQLVPVACGEDQVCEVDQCVPALLDGPAGCACRQGGPDTMLAFLGLLFGLRLWRRRARAARKGTLEH